MSAKNKRNIETKDKRTKEQILKLLDRAIEQEERLSEKIKILEGDLKDCRKKVEDPRHELTDEALSASKISFRIDYYRTSEESPLKGIIEHLPSRQNKSFEGEGTESISGFIGRYLQEETSPNKKGKPAETAKSTELPANRPTETAQDTPPPEVVRSKLQTQENVAEKQHKVRLLPHEETADSTSALMQRLRDKFGTETGMKKTTVQPASRRKPFFQSNDAPEAARIQRKAASMPDWTGQRPKREVPDVKQENAGEQSDSRLLRKLRETLQHKS